MKLKLKRLINVFGSITGLSLVSPLLAIISIISDLIDSLNFFAFSYEEHQFIQFEHK